MFALLSPKLWLALIIAGMIAGAGFTGYRKGRAAVRAEWNADKLVQQQAALRLIEKRDRDQDDLNNKARKADNDLQKQKALRVAADRVADGLRSTLADALGRAASEDTRTPSGIDAADPRPAIAGECVGQLVALDKAYGRLVDQARALQDFAGNVCVTPMGVRP